jgi:hypothetical protein
VADDIDLSAGLKPKTAAPEIDLSAGLTPKQAPSVAPSAPSSPLITSGEGQYQMKDKDGKVVPVSYSHVLDSIHQGHTFADKGTLTKFAQDHAADPNNHDPGSVEHLKNMSNWNPFKYLAAIGAGPIAVLEGAGGEAMKVATAFDKDATTEGETQAQLAAAKGPQNVTQGVGALGEQVGELFLAPQTKIAEGAKVGKAAKVALKTVEQGVRAAGEQGAQTYVHSGGDTEQAKNAAEIGGAVGAASPMAGAALKKLGEFGADVGRFFLKVGDMQTGTMVRETDKANAAIEDRAAEVRKANAEKVAQAEKDHADAVEKAKAAHEEKLKTEKAKYDDQVKKAKAPTETAQANNEFKEKQAQLLHEQDVQKAELDHAHEVEKARLAHEQALADEQAKQAKAEVANRNLLETRGRLFSRLKTIQEAAKGYFKKNYAEVENIVNRVDDKGQPHIDESNSVPMTDLADAVADAKGELKGSDESIKVFNDITKKMHGVEKAEKASGFTEHELESLAPDELAELHKEGGAPQSVGFSDLKGYYSELGRMLGSESVPGDVKQAVVKLREAIDDMQGKLAEDAGVGVRYKLLRNQYRNYARGFLDYQGGEGEASPVAKAVRKEDAANATKQFLDREPEEMSRIKQLIAGTPDQSTQFVEGNIVTAGGKEEPAWRYRKNTTKLLDNFLKANQDAENATKAASAKPVGEFVPPEYKAHEYKAPKPGRVPEPKPVGDFKPPEYKEPVAKPPKLDDVPEKTVVKPDDVRKLKEENLLNRASLLNHFGTYMAVSGLVGSVFALTGGDPAERVKRGAEGVLVGAVSPYLMARIVERPDVIKALTTVTKKDLDRLMKLPADQRSGVEAGIKALADKAIEKGKLKANQIPWLRIVGGKAAVAATKPQADTAPAGESEEEIQKDLDEMQSDSPHPETHYFSISEYRKTNPTGNVDAAKSQAQGMGYEVVP